MRYPLLALFVLLVCSGCNKLSPQECAEQLQIDPRSVHSPNSDQVVYNIIGKVAQKQKFLEDHPECQEVLANINKGNQTQERVRSLMRR